MLNLIPDFGPLVASVPAVLFALGERPATAGYTALLFAAVQTLEGNVLIPLIQKGVVDLPPALTIVAVMLGGVFFGPLGMVLAPLAAARMMVAVRLLYLRDRLGDPVKVPGE